MYGGEADASQEWAREPGKHVEQDAVDADWRSPGSVTTFTWGHAWTISR